jgi:hypothetical protein
VAAQLAASQEGFSSMRLLLLLLYYYYYLACDSRCQFIDILRLIIGIINLIPDILIRLVCVCSTGFCSSACLLFSLPIWLYALVALISLLQYAQAFSLPGLLSRYTVIFVANI